MLSVGQVTHKFLDAYVSSSQNEHNSQSLVSSAVPAHIVKHTASIAIFRATPERLASVIWSQRKCRAIGADSYQKQDPTQQPICHKTWE